MIASAIVLGVAIGLGGFTFVYARGYSYLGHEAEACANCHVMQEHFDAWLKSSHRAVAACNDCHTPHALLPKYYVKAKNGFWHSFYFTTGTYPYPLRITESNHDVTEGACRHCHERVTAMVDHAGGGAAGGGGDDDGGDVEPLTCTRCHRHVGHWIR